MGGGKDGKRGTEIGKIERRMEKWWIGGRVDEREERKKEIKKGSEQDEN